MIDLLRERARVLGEQVGGVLGQLEQEKAALAAVKHLAESGLLGFTIPERDGGAATGELASSDAVSVRALCVIRDELAYHAGMLDLMFVMQGLGSYAVALGGNERLRGEVLPEVAGGKSVAGFGLTEPGAGSSLTEVSTRAVKNAEGWVLDGHKTFISNASLARFFTVLARTSGKPGDKAGLSMFFVPADAWGVNVEPFEVLGEHPIGDVYFKECQISAEFLLGEEGGGLELALAVLHRFRSSVAAAANGFARRAIDESVSHLKQREQFGKPLAANQGLRFDLAEMDTRLRAAQLLVAEAAGDVDSGQKATLSVSRAKLFATETAGWICDRAVQHHGGLGVKRGTMVEHLYRDVRALRIYEGTSEVQKLIIARELL